MDIIRRGHQIDAAVVSNLAFQNPKMRILEIGGASAAATTKILEALGSSFVSYHFTDATPKLVSQRGTAERQDGLCLTESHWDRVLKTTGFSGIDASVQPGITTGHLTDMELDDQYGIVLALETPFWSDITEDDLKKMQRLIASAHSLLWLCLHHKRVENAGFRFVTLDLEEQQVHPKARITDTIMKVFKHAIVQDNESKFFDELEFTEIDEMLQISRALLDREGSIHYARDIRTHRPLTLTVGQVGLLDSIHYVDDKELLTPLKVNEVEISTAAAGMNFIDIMMSLGQIPPSRKLGQECSGTISAIGQGVHDLAVGDRVFIARLSGGELVLIHAAACGVGPAAIMLAKIAGAEIYVTVGSNDKKRLMLEEYGIPEDRIFSSRDASFKKELMAKTGDHGVDIGKRDFVQNSNLEMNKFLQSVTFAGVDLGVFGQNRPPAFHQMLSEMVDLHSRKVLESIKPLNVYPISEMQKAMRMMQSGKHIGPPSTLTKDDQQHRCLHLITGGTGGLGRSITRRLAREGAKNIILASRSGLDQKGISELVSELQALGVTVFVDRCDVADPPKSKHSSQEAKILDLPSAASSTAPWPFGTPYSKTSPTQTGK
ncbi:MAG: hypothetical protein Q9205_003166 [Flavoplaca limonia]